MECSSSRRGGGSVEGMCFSPKPRVAVTKSGGLRLVKLWKARLNGVEDSGAEGKE